MHISSFPRDMLSQEYMSLLTAGARALYGPPPRHWSAGLCVVRGGVITRERHGAIAALACACGVCGAARALLRETQLTDEWGRASPAAREIPSSVHLQRRGGGLGR